MEDSKQPSAVSFASSRTGLENPYTLKHRIKGKVILRVSINKVRTAIGVVEARTGTLCIFFLGPRSCEEHAHHCPSRTDGPHHSDCFEGRQSVSCDQPGLDRGSPGSRRGFVHTGLTRPQLEEVAW